MKKFFYITLFTLFVSCTSNTFYKAPKDLIPKDSMVTLLTDMYIASSAKNVKNKFLKKEKNYVGLVYRKYKIDSTRFKSSNLYYTSLSEEYAEILKEVKTNLDSLENLYRFKKIKKDSLPRKKKILNEELSLKLSDKNQKLQKPVKKPKAVK
ncbi:DUF4296 domain-containing protein [Tenacibaculum sp. HL-MS23]|uniref:DUF4296 domain-containing protein n=1 Tax=Tenacibaculum sp. HL-MS23 TaxID=3077734 RepID=UPI0028FC188B|nr:DUF4296 domain-containing protein [Tenacibaculum sp. HL-MS23]WNW01008.1 DUF4296 domain-containing protein [Tenacibaculum sp. HL-MS23]